MKYQKDNRNPSRSACKAPKWFNNMTLQTSRHCVLYSCLVAWLLVLLSPSKAVAQDCPSPPNGFAADIQGPDLIFTWENATDCVVTSYELQVSLKPDIASQPLSGISFHRFRTPASSSIRFVGVGLTPRVYYARLVAFASAQRSLPSREVTIIVGGGCGVPGAPRSVQAGVDPTYGGGVYLLSWVAPEGCRPEAYLVIVERIALGVVQQTMGQQYVTASTMRIFLGAGEALYRVRVRAVSKQGQSAEAETTFAVTTAPSLPPVTPANFRADVLGNGVVLFTWDGGVFGSAGTVYTLLVSQSPNDPNPIRSPMGPIVSGVRVQASVSGVFYLRLVAANNTGESQPSNEVALYLPPRN